MCGLSLRRLRVTLWLSISTRVVGGRLGGALRWGLLVLRLLCTNSFAPCSMTLIEYWRKTISDQTHHPTLYLTLPSSSTRVNTTHHPHTRSNATTTPSSMYTRYSQRLHRHYVKVEKGPRHPTPPPPPQHAQSLTVCIQTFQTVPCPNQ